MPKAFSEHEREIVKEAMLNVSAALIRKKGIRQVTVEDITRGANIAKGSFYAFFQSRETLFWNIIKLEEKQLLDKISSVAAEDIDIKTKVQRIFYDLFLHDGCLVFYLTQEDTEYITRKLPPELIQADMENGQDIIRTLLSMCKLDESQESIEIMMSMIHSLQYVASSELLKVDTARKKMLSILVEAFADYLGKGEEFEQHEQKY